MREFSRALFLQLPQHPVKHALNHEALCFLLSPSQEMLRGKAGADLQLNFIPPNDRFELLSYKIPSTGLKFPVRGFYQLMVSEIWWTAPQACPKSPTHCYFSALQEETPTSIKLLLQLKGSSDLPNAFDRFKVRS